MRQFRKHLPALLLALFCAPGAAWAEPSLYVIDSLRVTVRQDPGRAAAPVGVVVTGTALEELERRGGYVKVRGEDDIEGWIKEEYLSGEKPARLLQEDLAAENARLADELKGLHEELAIAAREKEHAIEALARTQQEQEGADPVAAGSSAADTAGEPRFQLSGDTLLYWIGGILFIALLGFVSGIGWYKNHVSRRLGGLRL